MNKIAISTLVWKRPQVFELFCKNFSSMPNKPIIVVAGSKGDECQDIAKKYGCIYEQVSNDRIGAKANHSVQMCKELDVDYIMLTGSDDLMSVEMWDYFSRFDGEVLGLLDFLFYHPRTERTIHWNGYRNRRVGEPIGAHKLIRKDVMEKINFEPFSNYSKYPDEHDTHKKLLSLGVEQKAVKMIETGGIGVDVKTPDNITKFNLWDNSRFVLYAETIGKHACVSKLIREA